MGVVRLLADDFTTWLEARLGTTVSNSSCIVDAAGLGSSSAGNGFTFSVPVTFKPAFTGRKTVFLEAVNIAGRSTGWFALGNYWPNASAGTLVNRYRLYDSTTHSHHYTTDPNEYTTLSARGFAGEGSSGQLYDAHGAANAAPYYRIYIAPAGTHFWTTDRNEYLTLLGYTGYYLGEGIDGFLLQSQAAGTVPLHRLVYFNASPPIHHWTADTNEYTTLVASKAWIDEGISGYLYPGSSPAPRPRSIAARVAPWISTVLAYGAGQARALNADGRPNFQLNPAGPGSVITLHVTGVRQQLSASVDGYPAEIVSADEETVRLRIPPEAVANPVALVFVKSGETFTQAGVTIAVK